MEPLSRHARAFQSRDFSHAFFSVQCPSSASFPRKFVFILYDSEDKIENVGRMIMLDGWDRWGLSWWILENLGEDWPLLTCPISFYFSVHCISTSLCSYSSWSTYSILMYEFTCIFPTSSWTFMNFLGHLFMSFLCLGNSLFYESPYPTMEAHTHCPSLPCSLSPERDHTCTLRTGAARQRELGEYILAKVACIHRSLRGVVARDPGESLWGHHSSCMSVQRGGPVLWSVLGCDS